MTSIEQQLETYFTLSLRQYREVLNHLHTMDKAIGKVRASDIQKLNDTLTDLQNKAMQTDKVLDKGLAATPELSDMFQALAAERRRLIKEILVVNKQVLDKAKNVKSYLSHEMGRLRKSLSAMSGYRQHQHNQGRIINSYK